MGVDRNLYLGPYVEITPITRDVIEKTVRCEKCNKKLRTEFCSDDGGKAISVEEKVEERVSIHDLLEEMGEEWEDFISDIDNMGCISDNNIYVFNTGDHSIDIDDTVILPSSDFSTDSLSEDESLFVQTVKAMYGEDSIKVHHGLLYYFS